MNYYIITGTSKGLGEAIANQLIIEENNRVYCLSRSINENLLKKAKECHSIVEYFKLDITNINEVEEVVSRILQSIEMQPTDSITLINNAGVIEPITTVGNMLAEDLNVNVVTNLLAPMVITNVFLNKTEYVEAEKCIVNVSSGAANRAISGWSSYCSTKAGLDMFTKTVGLEQQQKQFPTTVISFSPGIMDTTMQTTIRSKTEKEFESVQTFQAYKEEGMLRTPTFVAEALLKFLKEDLINGEIYDIKQLL